MYNHNKAQQSKNRVHISWDILFPSHNALLFDHECIGEELPPTIVTVFQAPSSDQ